MVKADYRRDYYADLELRPSADTEEIRKQFRKLARLYHPDRNPGKEAEYVPKFQAIQAAHEILTDTEQRTKYDADRRKHGLVSTFPRPNVPPRSAFAASTNFPPPPRRTATTSGRSDYQDSFKPSAGTARFRNFPKPPTAKQSSATDDAQQRTNNFYAWERMAPGSRGSPVPPAPPRGAYYDSSSSQSAWETYNRNKAQRNNAAKTPKKPMGFDPATPGADEPQARGTSGYARPGTSRMQTDFPPTQSAFDSTLPTPPKPDPLAQFRSRSGEEVPFAEGSPRIRTPYNTSGGEKTYFSTEALRRSASTRDNSRRPQSSEQTAVPNSAPRSSTRHRSASPSSRKPHMDSRGQEAEAGWQSPRFGTNAAQPRPRKESRARFDIHDSSDESDESSDSELSPRHGRRTERSSAPEPEKMFSGSPHSRHHTQSSASPGDFPNRPKAEPSPSWARSNGTFAHSTQFSPQASAGSPANGTARGSMSGLGQKSNSTMYEQPFQNNSPQFQYQPQSNNSATPRSFRWPFSGDESNGGNQLPPYWAYPSSVAPPKMPTFGQTSHKRPASQQAGPIPAKAFPFAPSFEAWQPHPRLSKTMDEFPRSSKEATQSSFFNTSQSSNQQSFANATPMFSFSFPDHTFVPPPPDFRSRSTESINTKFSPGEWNGKFEGAPDYFGPPNARKDSRSRSRHSPVRGPTPLRKTSSAQESPVNSTQANSFAPNGASQFTFPTFPPPPPPPPRSSEPTVPPPGKVQFSADEWAKTMKGPNLFIPQPKPPSPVRPGSVSSSVRRPKTPRARAATAGPKLPTTVPKPASVSEVIDESDVPNSAPSTAGGNLDEAIQDDNAMDIDGATPIQPTTSQGQQPRLVPVQPIRPEWRDQPTSPVQHHHPPQYQHQPIPPPPPFPPKQPDVTLHDLQNVAPFTPAQEGLKSLSSDLSTTLPFPSRSSPTHPTNRASPQPLELPQPPKAPQPPPATERVTQAAWSSYLAHMRVYLAEWNRYNKRMLGHFEARQALAEGMVKDGGGWMEQVGEVTGRIGVEGYLRGLREDERVRMHWTVSCERHREAVEGLEGVRGRVGREGVRSVV